jgi:hypothetical protein
MLRAACFAAALAFAVVSASLGQEGTRATAKKVGPHHFEQFGILNLLGQISYETGTPIGLDAVLPEKESTIAFDFPGGSVADLLNMLVAEVPDYRWEEARGGVIHFYRPGGHVGLIDVVMSYPGAVKRTRKQIWEDIASRPEISSWLSSTRCSRSEFFTGSEFRTNNDRISISSGDVTLAQLLDATAVKSGSKFWAVLQSPPSTTPCQVSIILW